jgi:hypothetical protein
VPELGTSLDAIFDLSSGEALDGSAIELLLNKLQTLGTISQETRNTLLQLYNTKPTEEFIEAYATATKTNAVVADANKPIEMATFTPIHES